MIDKEVLSKAIEASKKHSPENLDPVKITYHCIVMRIKIIIARMKKKGATDEEILKVISPMIDELHRLLWKQLLKEESE